MDENRLSMTCVPVTYRQIRSNELSRIGEIDRSERIETIVVQRGVELDTVPGDFSAPPWQREGVGEHSVAHQVEECERLLAAGGIAIGAFADARLVGLGIVVPHVRDGVAQLAFLHVSEGYRGRGIGGRLSARLEQVGRDRGDTAMVVSATPSANTVRFYRGRGFEPPADPLPELFELEPEDVHLEKRLEVMFFEVAADAYDRFIGRYSPQLAPQLADLGGIRVGQRILDVGCGPGALTDELVERVGAEAVCAVDPSESFVAAARARHPGVDVRRATAEQLPFDDAVFDAALAQLVVHFMTDPVAGLREMKRVTSPGGVVAACVWDHTGDRTPLAGFWQAARELDPEARGASDLAGAREGHLGELFVQAGLRAVQESTVEASARFASFDEWWEPFSLGVGPAGAYAQTLDQPSRDRLRARCRQLLPPPPFTLNASAWAARGVA